MAEEKQVSLPAELVDEIDALIGAEKRDAFLAELVRSALQREQILRSLRDGEPVWKDEDHPDLVETGTEGWVQALRQEGEERFIRVHQER